MLSEKSFRQILKKQSTAFEAKNDGSGYVQYITQAFEPFLLQSVTIGFDFPTEAAKFASIGLNQDNAYLHVRGHNIYDLTINIGKMYSRPLQLSFIKDVMNKVVIGGKYWEYEKIEDDLRHI